jgi:hypothetical protein
MNVVGERPILLPPANDEGIRIASIVTPLLVTEMFSV